MPLLSGALGALKDSAVSVMSLIVTMAASDFQGPDFQDSSKFFSSRISPLPPSGLPELAPALRWTFDICATVFCDISDRLNCGVEALPLSGSKY